MQRTIEVAIFLGIALVLLGLVFPVLRSHRIAEDVRIAREDLEAIRGAVLEFHRDTGLYPSRGADGEDGGLYRLCGPGHVAPGSYFRSDLRQGWLEDHLERNDPAPLCDRPYTSWRGPYWDARPDPWGSAYVMIAYPAARNDGRDCIAVSAGPDRRMDADYSSPYDVRASGDDLIVVILDKSSDRRLPVFAATSSGQAARFGRPAITPTSRAP